MIVQDGVEVLESISLAFPNISPVDMAHLFDRCSVKVTVNHKLIADPSLKHFDPVGDWHRFELEYKVKPGDSVVVHFDTVPPFTTEYGLTLNAALSFRGNINALHLAGRFNAERSHPGRPEAKA